MEYKRPDSEELEQIVVLQNKNLVSALESSEKSDGFLSEAFSMEQFREMDDDLCVLVGKDENTVCAYVCVSSVEYNKNIPIVRAMLDCFPQIIFKGKPLTAYCTAIPGPVCIDKEYRGRGILLQLYKELPAFLLKEHPELDLYAVLISKQNQRSINAHKKLGMEVVGEFAYKKGIFSILVKSIDAVRH